MAPPNRPPPRVMTVIRTAAVTPNMLRVTLGGPGLTDFPPDQAGGYLKLRLPRADNPAKMDVRTYTIRAQRQLGDAVELDVDFALHGGLDEAGPATRWALQASAGSMIEAGGPGPAKPLAGHAAWHLVAGDMTALPAISANLERLPATARGTVLIEITTPADQQDLVCPAGVAIHWLVNAHPGADGDLLARTLRALPWPDACAPSAIQGWVAAEFSAMQALRRYLRDERGLGPDQLYISSYWKAGQTEDGHRETKRADAL